MDSVKTPKSKQKGNNTMSKISEMTPAEIAKKGQELIKLARKKEADLRNKTILALGLILSREIDNSCATSRADLETELEAIVSKKVDLSGWFTESKSEPVFVTESPAVPVFENETGV